MKLINFQQLRVKMGGRSRNAIFADIDKGRLPPPRKFGDVPGAKNYWDEEAVDRAIASFCAPSASSEGSKKQ